MVPHFANAAEQHWVDARMLADFTGIATRRFGVAGAANALKKLYDLRKSFEYAWGPPKYVRLGDRWFPRLVTPSWPSPTFSRWLETRMVEATTGKADPHYLSIVFLGISSRCSLHCSHCSASKELIDREFLPIEQHISLVQQLQDRGLMQLQLTGGEPMGRFEDMLRLLRSMKPDTETWINTSGMGLTAPRAQELAAAGLTGVMLSIDHWDPARHDTFRRGHGIFEHAVAAAEATTQAGLALTISVCPTREFANRADMDHMHRLAGELKASFLRIVEPRATGSWAGADVSLRPEHTEFLDRFEIEANTDPARAHLPVVVGYDGLARRMGCSLGGDRGFYIDSHGEAHSCPFCGVAVGNVITEGLDVVLGRLRARGCGRHVAARLYEHPEALAGHR